MKDYLKLRRAKIVEMLPTYIPHHMHQAILHYLDHGISPGDFLSAVIQNDFRLACLTADFENCKALVHYGVFFSLYMPDISWGSPENMANWKGLEKMSQVALANNEEDGEEHA